MAPSGAAYFHRPDPKARSPRRARAPGARTRLGGEAVLGTPHTAACDIVGTFEDRQCACQRARGFGVGSGAHRLVQIATGILGRETHPATATPPAVRVTEAARYTVQRATTSAVRRATDVAHSCAR